MANLFDNDMSIQRQSKVILMSFMYHDVQAARGVCAGGVDFFLKTRQV